jgi:hypothetical protein
MSKKFNNIDIPNGLTSRNKSIRGKKSSYWAGSKGYFAFKDQTDDPKLNRHEGLLFLMLLDNYTKRNKDTDFKSLVEPNRGWHQYWNPYINASECRNIVKYFRDAMKRGTVYMLEKEVKCKAYRWGDYEKNPTTLVITKRAYTEEALFMKALMNDGIRGLNGSEKHWFNRLMKFMENSKGVWH